MKIYRAKTRIDHGEPDGTVTVYKPGDEIPAKLALALPKLIECIEIQGVERISDPAPSEIDPMTTPLARLNKSALCTIAAAFEIDATDKPNADLREAIEQARKAATSNGSQSQE